MPPTDSTTAPGAPGIPARWTSSAKEGVGTALSAASRVWFTVSHGILDEVYYSRVDNACIRDLGLIVTDGAQFFSEEKRQTNTHVEYLADGAPAYRIVNSCVENRYTIQKEIFADPRREVILQRVEFRPQDAQANDLQVYALLAPHLGNQGSNNTAWVGEYKGTPMLFAERDGIALALACSRGWQNRSAGFVGFSDGWQDLSQNKKITWFYERAERGNVALVGEVPPDANDGSFVLALGFGANTSEAALRAIASLQDDFDELRREYLDQWTAWQQTLLPLDEACPVQHRDLCINRYRISAAVLRTHEEKRFPGGIIASLSVPWGFSKGDNDLGGYHLAWPRDLVETAGALIAAGAHEDVCRVLHYLQSTQEPDGHWAQNMWLDGRPYWNGVQMDETALPILLVDLARREGSIDQDELRRLWPMVRRASSYLVCNGPVTQQDRWEEDAGYSPFTLAAEITALLAAADMAETACEDADQAQQLAMYLRETADDWYGNLDNWLYATETELAREVGVDGYYVRIAPPETSDSAKALDGIVAIKNRPPEFANEAAASVVSPDALALVRFGLRRADDPRIVNTVKAIDHLLRVDLPAGPCWHRYNGDGYGEHEDGRPFDGTGVGRAWPLLTGERAHYELAAGNREEAERLLGTFGQLAGPSGLIPEQVWDADDIPQRELFRGQPSGSAMPLVWAHGEYIKLLRSLRDGRVFDMPPHGVQRYLSERHESNRHVWRFNLKSRSMPRGRLLRVEVREPAFVRWSSDGGQTWTETPTADTQLGVHVADLPTEQLSAGTTIEFSFLWRQANRWEDQSFSVTVSQ
ncbi:MAG: glucan 1,4-alpha-glucosidase [Planctomycetales bacterium]|nr:glucan 1,4-alpha-glucosidase [Planctomycetales bacterium]